MPDRRDFLRFTATAALGAALPVLPRLLGAQDQPKATRRITVYKSLSCDCCRKWIEHVDRETDWIIDVQNMDDVTPIKDKLRVPEKMRSCHTAVIGRFVFEGHVPAALIKTFMERPRGVSGLAVPGMPTGTPGMEVPGRKAERYTVRGFYRDGRSFVYATLGG